MALSTFLVGLLSACGGAAQDDGAGDSGDSPDAAVEGLPPEEIQRRAEPMTPERAAELGVMDTTIQVGEEP